MKKLFGKKKEEGHNFWMSYTDMMAGFLIIFIIASFISTQRLISIDKKLLGYSPEQVMDMIKELEAKGSMVNINKEFIEVFKEEKGIEFNEEEGSIRFYPTYETAADSILFFSGSDVMMPNLKKRILEVGNSFVKKAMYLHAHDLKNAGLNNLEIRIEGHTDTVGRFLTNLNLSSARAFAVYKCIHDECGLNREEVQFVEDHMISVGYSYAKAIKDPNGQVNKNKSRRIEFRIISK